MGTSYISEGELSVIINKCHMGVVFVMISQCCIMHNAFILAVKKKHCLAVQSSSLASEVKNASEQRDHQLASSMTTRTGSRAVLHDFLALPPLSRLQQLEVGRCCCLVREDVVKVLFHAHLQAILSGDWPLHSIQMMSGSQSVSSNWKCEKAWHL